MNLRRKLLAFLKSQKKNTEYTELEYLESTGTQYINTGWIANQLIDKTLYIKMKNTGNAGNYAYNGAYDISGTGLTIQFGLYATSATQCRTTQNYFDPSYSQTPGLDKSLFYELQMDKTTYWLNGEVVGTHEQTDEEKIKTCVNPFFIFGRSQKNAANSITPMAISRFWIKNADGSYMMDLIPVLDKDFTPCMYDKVTGKFLYNQGSGEFKWKLPNQLEYLESDGNQFIKLGIIPTAETGSRIKASTVGQGDMIICGSRNDPSAYTRFYLCSTYSSANQKEPLISIGRGSYLYLQLDGSFIAMSSDLKVPFGTVYEQYTNYKNSKVTKFVDSTRTITSTTIPELTFTPDQPLYLFAGNIAGVTNYNYKGKIYSCEITEGDKIIMYLIPAFDKNLNVCMYDLVSRKYFYNQGSGTFKGYFEDGSQLVTYLSATGTQWIDTGITPLIGDEFEFNNVQCVKKKSGFQTIFSAGTGSYQLIILVADGGYSDRASFYKYFASGGAKNINPPNYLNDLTKIKIHGDGSVFYNDVFIIQSPPENETDSSMRLFYRANNSSPMTGNIGAVNIKRDDEFVINLVPVVKSDNTVCMLDLVRDKYLENSGSGSFTYATVANLFNPSNPSYIAGYISTNNNGNITASTLTSVLYIPCKPNTSYLITRSSVKADAQVWRAATVSETPYVNMLCPNFVGGINNDLALTITSRENDKYLIFSEGYTLGTDDLTKFTVVEIENSN